LPIRASGPAEADPSPLFRHSAGYDFTVQFTPQPLRSKPLPFDHPDYLYELKYDGFRALAFIEHDRCRLVSRNGTTFASFSVLCSAIGASLSNGRAVLDGEIACVDENGCPQFNDLLFHRAEPCFFAFDILSRDGRDLRFDALIDRKAELRRLLASRSLRAQKASRVCYVDYVERTGKALFDIVCKRDLEGIVAKLKHGHYATEREHSTWLKVKNKNYSQAEGRAEFFEGKKPSESVHEGWDSCSLVCKDMEAR
jgi:bifunctional non-homologous end joining protein LigD